jgi:hypothetical protein
MDAPAAPGAAYQLKPLAEDCCANTAWPLVLGWK